MLYGHGNDINNYNTTLIEDFSSNTWIKGFSTEISDAIVQSLPMIQNYPDPDARRLRIKIAQQFDLTTDNVLVTNGSTEAFYLVAHAFKGCNSTIVKPSFSEYTDACKVYNHTTNYLKNTDSWINTSFHENLVWFANPNNPDGKTISIKEIEDLLIQNPATIFVVDEAYVELSYVAECAISLIKEYDNLIIIKSLTKAFSIPGIRLGYIISSGKIITKIKQYIIPWSVNTMAVAAGCFIIENYNTLLPNKLELKELTIEFQEYIATIPGLIVQPSTCNFFLVNMPGKRASELKKYLVEEHRLLIRDASNFDGLSNSYFRLAVRSRESNRLLVQAIQEWMNS